MISVVVGKPGSGKSYEVVRELFERFLNVKNLRAELPLVFTNLRLNLPEWGEFADYISILDDDFFYGQWWDQLPDGALCVLDEAQYYLSDKRLERFDITALEEHFSTHRHRNLEYILITQSLTSLSISLRRYVQTVTFINNTKNLYLPFPINIPVRDIQVLLRGFGISWQFYYAVSSDLINTYKTDKQGANKFHMISREITRLYCTNKTGKNDDIKLPFALGRGAWRRALSWFFYTHFFNFAIKLSIVLFCAFGYIHIYNKARRYLDEHKKTVVLEVVEDDESKAELFAVPDDVVDGSSVELFESRIQRTDF